MDYAVDTFTTTVTYDSYGNVTSVTDPESNTVTFSYSSDYGHAYLTETSTTIGIDTLTTKATYDYYRGWITSEQAPKGVEAGSGYDVLYTYDVLGRIIKKEFPLLPHQSQRSYIEAVYDCENQTITIIDPLGHYTVREHDNLGRLTSVKTYTGQYGSGTLYAVTSYTSNYSDQVLSVTDPQNHTITYTYDFLGRVTNVVSADSSVTYSYDDMYNNMIFTNGRGYQRIFWFDWLSRLTKVEEEYETDLFAVTTYQYGEGNHLISFTDAENHTTSYTYGSLFGLTRITYPDYEYEEYTYDTAGNVASYTDAEGNSTHLIYDALYRLTQIQYDQSVISFAYDLNSNRIRMDDNSPSEGDYCEYTYDEWNRLTTETRYISQTAYTITYQYDIASRLTTLTYPDNMQILYSYDDLNRITEIKRYIDGVTDEILLDNVQYNAESLLTQFDYGNDLQALFSYDSRDRISTIAVKNQETSYLNLDYSYDSNTNITEVINGWRDTSSDWHSQPELYSYDGLDRLVSATSAAWSHTYSYDKAGNRTAKDQTTSTINAVNQVTDVSDGTTFTYDRNGNRTGKTNNNDTWLYTYDSANRLTKVEKNSVILGEYIYDGDGKRIQTIEDSKSTTYIYSGLNILYEENTTGTALYIYGPTGRLAKRTTINNESSTFYYHADHQGSTRLVTDESKSIVTDVIYEPFGEPTVTGEESFLYTGKEKDTIDLYYYGARYYDPDLGRFMTRDPLSGRKALPQSLNRYTYCVNNPVKYIDPKGLTYKLCDVDSGHCNRILEGGQGGWIAYDEEGNIITTSQQIEGLIASENPADQAYAVYLMLLVTHPEIGGVSEMQTDPSMIQDDATSFDYEVTIDGESQIIRIIISKKPFKITQNAYTGEIYKAYANTNKAYDSNLGRIITLTVYQHAFASVARLFHVIGHEGVHVIDVFRLGEGKTNKKFWDESEQRAKAWNRLHGMSDLFPWPLYPPPRHDSL